MITYLFCFRSLDRPQAADLQIQARSRSDAWLMVRELFPGERHACVGREPMWFDTKEQ